MKRYGLGILIVVAVAVIAVIGFKHYSKPVVSSGLRKVRIALTAYPDTSLYLYGYDRGFFRDEGIDLELMYYPWNEQIEVTAGGGVDVAMATLDEVVAKSRSLNTVGKRVVYFLPAWQFEGTIFVGQQGIKPFADFKKDLPEPDARAAFLKQLQGKLIAAPEGGMYDQAIRRFIKVGGQSPDSFRFINAQLETGINGLGDKSVGLAAAGAFERPEAERRGYKIALTPTDLDVIILTGFIASSRLYETDPELLRRFAAAWYRTVNEALRDQDNAYAIAKKYLDTHGGKVPPLGDYKAALAGNRFPLSPKDADTAFFSTNSASYWKRAWDRAATTLSESGKQDQVPLQDSDFVAPKLLQGVSVKK